MIIAETKEKALEEAIEILEKEKITFLKIEEYEGITIRYEKGNTWKVNKIAKKLLEKVREDKIEFDEISIYSAPDVANEEGTKTIMSLSAEIRKYTEDDINEISIYIAQHRYISEQKNTYIKIKTGDKTIRSMSTLKEAIKTAIKEIEENKLSY
jgi:hypothetical protein